MLHKVTRGRVHSKCWSQSELKWHHKQQRGFGTALLQRYFCCSSSTIFDCSWIFDCIIFDRSFSERSSPRTHPVLFFHFSLPVLLLALQFINLPPTLPVFQLQTSAARCTAQAWLHVLTLSSIPAFSSPLLTEGPKNPQSHYLGTTKASQTFPRSSASCSRLRPAAPRRTSPYLQPYGSARPRVHANPRQVGPKSRRPTRGAGFRLTGCLRERPARTRVHVAHRGLLVVAVHVEHLLVRRLRLELLHLLSRLLERSLRGKGPTAGQGSAPRRKEGRSRDARPAALPPPLPQTWRQTPNAAHRNSAAPPQPLCRLSPRHRARWPIPAPRLTPRQSALSGGGENRAKGQWKGSAA